MKKLYGVCDNNGEVYAAYSSPAECPGLETVELVENPTWERGEYSDPRTGTPYIRVDHLAFLFDELCKSTGMKKSALAKICGKNAATFSRYCSGETPVPQLVWDKVSEYKQ